MKNTKLTIKMILISLATCLALANSYANSSLKSESRGVGLNISLGAARIEADWRSTLLDVAEIAVKEAQLDDFLDIRRHEYDNRTGLSRETSVAYGALDFSYETEGMIVKCRLRAEKNSSLYTQGLFKMKLDQQFEEPQKVSFPSYAMTCREINEQGQTVAYLQRVYIDSNLEVSEEVALLK